MWKEKLKTKRDIKSVKNLIITNVNLYNMAS